MSIADTAQIAQPQPLLDGVMDLQPEHLRQTRSQIAALVAEIAVAAKTYRDQNAFFQLALERLREAMGGIGGAVWKYTADGRGLLLADHQLPEILLEEPNKQLRSGCVVSSVEVQCMDDIEQRLDSMQSLELFNDDEATQQIQSNESLKSQRPSESHLAILRVLDNEKQPTLIPPSTNPPPGRPPNETPYCLIYAPVSIEAGESIWLQAITLPAGGPTVYRGYLRFVVQVADILTDFLKSNRLRELTQSKLQVETAHSILSAIDDHRTKHDQLAPNSRYADDPEAAIVSRAIMRCLGADEAFFVYRSKTSKVVCYGPRANGLRITEHSEAATVLRRFADSFAGSTKSNCACWIDRDQDKAHSLFEVFGCGAMSWLPIHIKPADKASNSYFMALLVLWYDTDTRFERDVLEDQLRGAAINARLGLQYTNASNVHQALHEITVGTRRTSLLKRFCYSSKVRVIALLLILAVTCAIPVPMTLTAPATLVPREMQILYAPTTGVVDQVFVTYGQSIEVGQPVLQLKSDALDNEYESLVAERLENEQRRRDIELQLLRSNELTSQQRSSLEGEIQTLQVLAKSQAEHSALIEKQIEKLRICSKIKGVVGTWQVDSELNNKPVVFGQPLVTVYNPEAAWAFEVALQEHDVGHLMKQLSDQVQPKVFCRLDSNPTQLIPVELRTRDSQWILHETTDGTAVVPVYADVESKSIPHLTPGATATVEVVVGNQPVIWVLTRDLVLSLWTRIRLWI